MAADIESALGESSDLIQSSGGVFEVESDGQLLYSKKATNRFPEDGEVIAIARLIEHGIPLEEAKEEAAKNARHAPSFTEWLSNMLHGKR